MSAETVQKWTHQLEMLFSLHSYAKHPQGTVEILVSPRYNFKSTDKIESAHKFFQISIISY